MKKNRYLGKKVIVIIGPTASGKSDLAVSLAKQYNGEIISADSRQVYIGLDIGTGKITKKEMRGVPHHLLDITNPKRVYTVFQWKSKAKKAIHSILKRNKIPIVCGGTGFYVDTLIYDLELPKVPPNQPLRKKLSSKKTDELFVILKKLDPVFAKNIDAKNPHRLIRAIEIATKLGKVPPIEKTSPYEPLFIGIRPNNDALVMRIKMRLKKRMKVGMVKEAERLHKEGLSYKRMEALGLEYKYLAGLLQKKTSKKEFEEKLSKAIEQYAKRQITWFKRNKEIHWFENDSDKKIGLLVKNFTLKAKL